MKLIYSDYIEMVEENHCAINKYISTGRLKYLDNIWFAEGQRFYELGIGGLGKIHDLVPAAILKLLPHTGRSGVDAIEMTRSGRLIDHEIKMCTIDVSRVRQTPGGTLFFVSPMNFAESAVHPNNATSFRSAIAAIYSKQIKNFQEINTTLLVCNRKDNKPIFGFRIDSKKMPTLYSKMGKSRQIQLNRFIAEGKELSLPNTSLYKFEERMRREAPICERTTKKRKA